MRKRLVSLFLLMLVALQSVHVMATMHHTNAEHEVLHDSLTQSETSQTSNYQDPHAGHCQASHQFNYLPSFSCALSLSSQVQSLQSDYQVHWVTIQSSPLFRPPKA